MSTTWMRVVYGVVLALVLLFTVQFGVALALPGPKPPEDPDITFRQLTAGDEESGQNRLTASIDRYYGESKDYRDKYVDYQRNAFLAGAGLAALLQTAIPQSLVSGVARTPVIGSLALMAIAFVLSLCSEADAFVAVSFTPFPIGSQLAFLVFGPVVDAKLAFLYGATFRRRFVARLVVVAVPVALAGSLWFEVLLR